MRSAAMLVLLFAGVSSAQENAWARQIEAERVAAVEAGARDKQALADQEQPARELNLALARLATERQRLTDRRDSRSAVSERAGDLLVAALRRYKATRTRLDRDILPQLYRDFSRVLAERASVGDRIWELELPLDGSEQRPDGVSEQDYRITTLPLLNALHARILTLELAESKLAELEAGYQQQRATMTELITLVLGKSYWLRTDPALGVEVARRAKDDAMGLTRLVRRHDWSVIGAGRIAIILVLLGVMLLCHFRLRRTRPRLRYFGSAMLQSAQRTAAALAASAVAPAFLLAIDALLGESAPFAAPISVLLYWTAGVWCLRGFLWRLFRPTGLAVENWGMPADCAARLMLSASIATAAALLLVGPSEALRTGPFMFSQLPRLLYAGYLTGACVALILLVAPGGPVVATWTGRRGFLYRSRGIWFGLIALFLAGVLVMHAVGFRLGARMLMDNAMKTVGFALALTGLYQLLTAAVDRLASMVRRRALEADAGRAAAREQSQAVTAELTRVVSVATLVGTVYALIQFWDVQAGVRAALDAVSVFHGDTFVVTLGDACKAVALIVAGHFLVANLAGVYEFLVFPLLGQDDARGRYVFLAFARYAIFVLVYSAALLSLHFSFASLGWIAAAMSVGLGFGLQEIVANFVSGLILLVEGPIRVGDIITVGETAGVVERITIRATIVTNWDRQIIIVPNKRFITEELTNWTRNDSLVRRKITVGVRYGSDVPLVMSVLKELAAAHPAVVADPPPRVWFDAFGDSSLNFEIWFFADIMAGREALSDLRASIDARFHELGIEIPFPQRDLHVRSFNDDALAALLEMRKRERES